MTMEDLIRSIVQDEVRALRDALPDLLRAALKARGPETKEYLTTVEAAALAKVRPETVRAWVAAGSLPEHRAGRELRVRRDELEALMAHGAETDEVDLDAMCVTKLPPTSGCGARRAQVPSAEEKGNRGSGESCDLRAPSQHRVLRAASSRDDPRSVDRGCAGRNATSVTAHVC